MPPFQYLQSRVSSELRDAALAETLRNGDRDCADSKGLNPTSWQQLEGMDRNERIAALVLIRRIFLNHEGALQLSYCAALLDNDTTVRGYAWWAIAEHWRSNVDRMSALQHASRVFMEHFDVAPNAVIESVLVTWMASLVRYLDDALWEHCEHSKAYADSRCDEQFENAAVALSKDGYSARDYLGSSSSAVRSLAIGLCIARRLWILPLAIVKELASDDPDKDVRSMARLYCSRIESAEPN